MLSQVSLQFAPGVDLEKAKAVVSSIPGVLRVRQVFPNQEDEELQRMFVLDLDATVKEAALKALRTSKVVEGAELVLRRGIAPR